MSSADLLNRLRNYVRPNQETGWPPFVWLFYLGFLFIPATSHEEDRRWLWPTLLTIPPFLVLYFRHLRRRVSGSSVELLGIALLCYALTPVNPYANTYLTYSAAFAPFTLKGLIRPLSLTAALLGIHAAEVLLLRGSFPLIVITVLVCVVCCVGNSFVVEKMSKNIVLKLSQEEIRRLAAVAERERIGRDLHDLLGHTLSLIALKGELAGKLLDRNRDAAAREVAEVTNIAREALKQVRIAVTGIRSVGLEAELASSRALLECSGVMVTCHRDGAMLPAEIETTLAMILREATTNVHRHAGATQARIEVARDCEAALLVVTDNGRGGLSKRGNGLEGIGERVHSLGGSFEIESPRGQGTTLRVRLPMGFSASGAPIAISTDAVPSAGFASCPSVTSELNMPRDETPCSAGSGAAHT
jgi:two-component system, NarL family, sensor histidine kinase DesK